MLKINFEKIIKTNNFKYKSDLILIDKYNADSHYELIENKDIQHSDLNTFSINRDNKLIQLTSPNEVSDNMDLLINKLQMFENQKILTTFDNSSKFINNSLYYYINRIII